MKASFDRTQKKATARRVLLSCAGVATVLCLWVDAHRHGN